MVDDRVLDTLLLLPFSGISVNRTYTHLLPNSILLTVCSCQMFVAGAKLYLVFTRTCCSEAKTCHGVDSTFMGHILGIFGQKVEMKKVLFAEVRGPVLL